MMSDTPTPEPTSPDTQLLSSRGSGAVNIAMVLRREIFDGRYQYGDRLPAERNLASHFGASRGTVREALKRLEEDRLVARRIGSGTFVQYRERSDHEDVADATSPLELIEVRFAIEPHMVRLAVLNASARDLDELRDALEAVEAAGVEPDAFSRADEAFHLTLAACSKNPVMQWLYRHINDVRGHAQWNARKDTVLSAERIREYNVQHRRLFNAMHARDVDGAVNEITRHLDKAKHDLVGIGAEPPVGKRRR